MTTILAQMERLFGSDEALNVSFLTDAGVSLTLAEYNAMYDKVGPDKMPGCQSLFPDGSSAVCCTDYAVQIYRALPGRVRIMGFANEDNPTSRVARDQIHPGGHDFAVLDERYVVDPWIRLVAGVTDPDQIVFDMQSAGDAALVADIYGPQACWCHMELAEQAAADYTARMACSPEWLAIHTARLAA